MPTATTPSIHNTFVIERVYQSTPEAVFAAFTDPEKKRRWFIDSDTHTVEHFEMDFRLHGQETARIRLGPGTPVAGMLCESNAFYQNIVPNSRLVFASTMAIEGNCISATLVSIELVPVEAGTNLICTHQGVYFQGADGPDMRKHGWSLLLDKLADKLSR